MAQGFIFGGNTNETPDSLKRKRELIEAMMMGQRTPQNWGEGWGAVMKGIASGIKNRQLDKAETAGREGATSKFDKITSLITGTNPDIFGGSSAGGNIPMPGAGNELAATTPGGGSNYRDAIASIESRGSGDYNAVGPTHSKMGRALGRYQIMESNIGPWSREALGREVTPDEFMADPKLQDAIFDKKFGSYVEKYGPEGAAQAWFGGPGGVGKTNRKDVLGTTIGGYGQKFMNALGQGGGQDVAASMPASAFSAVMPELGGGSPSLSDEVAEYRQTPEFMQAYPGGYNQPFDIGRFGDPNAIQPAQGADGLQSALAGQEQSAGQQAIDTQMQAGGIPQQFQGSQQLMGAQGGMMPALMGGQQASAQQVAQAKQVGQQQSMGGSTLQQLYEAASHPWLTDQQRSVVNSLLERKLQEQDPVRQMQLQKGRMELEAMQREAEGGKRQPLINAGGGAIYDPNEKKWIREDEGAADGAFRFSGNSVEAQSLNGLMDSGTLTPDQAQQLGAGKTITGPNGEIIFLTPQGVFGSTPDGQTQKLSGGGQTTDVGQAQANEKQGNRQITEPKVTIDERRAMGFADRMLESGGIIDQNEKAGLNVKDQFIRGNDWIPDALENWMVGKDFQKFDQARRNFINSQLRRESGAVISPEEFDNANKQYFPQPGDGEDVLRQKAANRKTVTDAMARDAGPTYGTKDAGAIAEARQAIARGANREAVIQRLEQMGVNPEGL